MVRLEDWVAATHDRGEGPAHARFQSSDHRTRPGSGRVPDRVSGQPAAGHPPMAARFPGHAPMLRELRADPDSGLLGASTWLSGRTALLVQYWDSYDQL